MNLFIEHSVWMSEIYGVYAHAAVCIDKMWEYMGQGQYIPHSICMWCEGLLGSLKYSYEFHVSS